MKLMPHGVEHETPKTVFCCAVNIATLDVVRRSLKLLHLSKRKFFTVFGVSIDEIESMPYRWINKHTPRKLFRGRKRFYFPTVKGAKAPEGCSGNSRAS
jgi:hypothetical protein